MRKTLTKAVSFQPEVFAAIKAAAEAEQRTVSGYLNTHFTNLLLGGVPAPSISTEISAPAEKPKPAPKAKRRRA